MDQALIEPAVIEPTSQPVGQITVFRDVVKRYLLDKVRIEALCGINHAIAEHQTLFVVGPCGSGKTTFLNLLGLTEAAVLAAGYAPAIGFLQSGKPLSFVYDIADIFKFETVVPAAFVSAGRASKGKLDLPLETSVRRASRDLFRKPASSIA